MDIIVNHYYNIDCMDGMKYMSDESVDLTLTDIPYDGVNNARIGGGIREFRKGNADIITFDLDNFLDEIYRVTKGTIIIFCGFNQTSEIYNHFISYKNVTVREIVWEKTNPAPINGQHIYLSGIENGIWVKKKGATFNGFCKNTVFKYPIGSSDIHPTEKNHDLLAELISDNSDVGQTVFDPCSGSGSTLYIAKKLFRNYIGFELNEKYYLSGKNRLDMETAQTSIFDFI